MTDELTTNLKAGRMRVSRSRGAVGGALLILGGLWAGLIPFVGPYGNLAYTPSVNATWKWTAARGWLEVLPGGVAVVGGLLLIMSTNRVVASLGGWFGVAAGGWLVVGPALAEPLGLSLGTPDPNQTSGIRAVEAITFFFGIGAAVVLVSGLALGRLSVHSVRDVQAAERRAAAEAELIAEEQRRADERAEYERVIAAEHADRERAAAENAERDRLARENAERVAAQEAERDRTPAATSDPSAATAAFQRPAAESTPAPEAGAESNTSGQHDWTDSSGRSEDRAAHQREADDRFTAERARIVEERQHAEAPSEPEDDAGHEPAHAAPATPFQPSRGDYPPFYGNRST